MVQISWFHAGDRFNFLITLRIHNVKVLLFAFALFKQVSGTFQPRAVL